MSPLGKILFDVCNHDLTVNMTAHWRTFYLAGYTKGAVEKYAESIGMNVINPPPSVEDRAKPGGTIIGMTPVGRHTIMGIPIPRIDR